jgi:GNAT superfamily N-acetyltransferase
MSPAEPVPRRATVADAATVAELLDSFNHEFGVETPGQTILAARLTSLLSADAVYVFLAGEPALGTALVSLRPNVWFDGPVALLDELYVVPERRGHGIGTLLLKAAEQECVRRGGRLLEINVDGEDSDARRFYERHGYRNREPGAPEPALYYSREL